MQEKKPTIGDCEQAKVQTGAFLVNYHRITKRAAPAIPLSALVEEIEQKYALIAAEDPEANVEKCDQCGGWSSPADVPEACPYCNDGNAELSKEAMTFMAELEVPDDDTAIDSVALEQQVEDIKAGKKDLPEQKMVRRPAVAPKPGAPLVALAGGKSVPNSDELDRAITRYRAAGGAYATANYEAGEELRRMQEYSLWQQRLGENGKQKYKTFEQFVKVELNLSKTVAYRLMTATRSFSKEAFAKLGFETAAMIAGAPEEMHNQLLKEAESGATTREILGTIRENKAKLGLPTAPPATPGAARTNAATIAAAKKREEKRDAERATANAAKERAAITLGLKTNTFTSKMKAKGCLPGQPPAAAGEIRDVVLPEEIAAIVRDQQWYFQVPGVNGVMVTMGIVVDAAGHVTVKGDARRVKEDEEGEEAAA